MILAPLVDIQSTVFDCYCWAGLEFSVLFLTLSEQDNDFRRWTSFLISIGLYAAQPFVSSR